jgi:hypothetical protein
VDIQAETDALVARYYRSQIRPETRAIIRADMMNLIHRWYAEGGYLCDRFDRPILDVEDVEVAIYIDNHSCSITTSRKEELRAPTRG